MSVLPDPMLWGYDGEMIVRTTWAQRKGAGVVGTPTAVVHIHTGCSM